MVQASTPLVLAFVVLAIGLLVFWAICLRRQEQSLGVVGLVALWATAVAVLAQLGVLSSFKPFPRVGVVIVVSVMGTVLLSRSSVGGALSQLPITLLVGFQVFRVLVELGIHQAVLEGVSPPQLTWTGMNWDIVSGLGAVPVALLAHRLPKWALLLWNSVGLGLLLNVVVVAVLSMPTPFQQLTPDNTWVAEFPFVWLPVLMVTSALLGHLLVYRKLLGGATPTR